MPAKLLLDENLAPRVAKALCLAGVDVVHVRDRDLLGATDTQVPERAYTEDRVISLAGEHSIEDVPAPESG